MMGSWLWGVNGILWLVALALVGIGIWKLRHGLKLQGRVIYVVAHRELLWLKHEIAVVEEELKSREKRKSQTNVDDSQKERHGWRTPEIDITDLDRVLAISKIALAAACFAGASVLMGVSAVLIALFMA